MKTKQAKNMVKISKQRRGKHTDFKPAILSHTISKLCLYSVGAFIGQSMLVGASLAAPQGGQIVGGQGAINQNGSATVIHSTLTNNSLGFGDGGGILPE